jgi:dTMP kinase
MFISLEGIDGSGKTTQLGLLAKWLSAEGHRVFLTEWNSSALVKAATKTGKKKNALTPMTFSLLHATDFADRLLYKIIPPLKAGMIVLADRYAYTAFAGVARGLGAERVEEICDQATGGIWPDVTILLRIDPDDAASRIGRRQADRFEGEGIELQRLVAEGYDEVARRHPERVRIVEAKGDRDAVHAAVLAEVQGVRNARVLRGGAEEQPV